MSGSQLCIPRQETAQSSYMYLQNRIKMFSLPIPTLIYFQDGSFYLLQPNTVCGPILVYINRSQPHECGNWDWGRAIARKGIHKWDFRCSACLGNVNFVKLSPSLFSSIFFFLSFIYSVTLYLSVQNPGPWSLVLFRLKKHVFAGKRVVADFL